MSLQKRNLKERLKSNNLKILNQQNNLRVSTELLQRLLPLKDVGALSEVKMLQQEQKITSIENKILQLESERENIRTQAEAKINDNESKLKQIFNTGNSKLKSYKGEVFNMKANSNSYVSTRGEVLMEVIPKEGLSASLKVSNKI